MIINAKELREKSELEKISNDKPGYYKWWATKTDFDYILQELGADFSIVEDAVEVKGDYYCIYVGIAFKKSIQGRLNWHVNDPHTESSVRNGTLSTLRQSLSSIYAHNQRDKATTNACIDRLKVEYFYIDMPMGSPEAKEELHRNERKMLNEYLRVLNIMENHHPLATDIKKKLRKLRKESKRKR